MSAPYIFDARISDPTGLRIDVTITVPEPATWPDVGDAAEIAQMAASRGLAQTRQARSNYYERPPF
jgi:hypothetical protein